MTVPVFISYHGTDVEIARALRTSLLRLSADFDVFLDRDSIAEGANYEQVIAAKIRDAEWFVIVCTGLPRRTEMEWSYFEAGQFRATLKDTLASEADKRMVCIFDDEPPSILSKFQGVHVSVKQRSGKPIDMSLRAGENIQIDDSAIFNLLEQMTKNTPGQPLRDLVAASTREMLREESHKLIALFLAAGATTLVKETSLQPRISFELLAGTSLSPQTAVKGYEGSLKLLFAITSEETKWADIMKSCCTANGGKPAWLADIELAAAEIMEDRAPDSVANKCLLQNVIYRVYTARYEIYKDLRRVIYVVFLPVSRQPFDLTRRSSTLLSSMILSIRFREQLIPMAKPLQAQPSADMLQKFYRLLLEIEMEARQFGLVIESNIPDEESPLAAAFTDDKKRAIIRARINDWTPDRAAIEKVFVDEPLDLKVPGDIAKGAMLIAGILKKITRVNAEFIEMIAEELLAQIKAGDRGRPDGPRKNVKTPPDKKTAGKPPKKASRKR